MNDGYINAIYPLSPYWYVCVREHTAASLGVLSPTSPSLNIGFQPGDCCFLCLLRFGEGGSVSKTPQMSVHRRGAGSVSVSVPGLWLPIPGCVGVLRIRGEPPKLPACFPAVMAASITSFAVSASCLNVCFFSLSPLLLRFLGSSCSGCLPSLSTGHARNLRHRNFKSRWRRASQLTWLPLENGAGAPPNGAHGPVTHNYSTPSKAQYKY